MARINIEECWWSDPRRTALLLTIGFEADSAAVNLWRTAQEFWGRGKSLIPKTVFDKVRHSEALIEAGLADVQGAFVYVRGSSEYLSWHADRREQARLAGLKSAESRRKKHGTAQPKGGRGSRKTEPEPNENRTTSNQTEPSGSLSGSLSVVGEMQPTANSVEKFQSQFHPERDLFDQGLAKLGIKRELRFHLGDVLSHFETYEAFKEWVNPIYNAKEDKMEPAEMRRYIIVALKREIGVLREAVPG